MALGDGITWAESLPDNSTLAHQIDDYDRDLRVGVRSRMAREHVWSSSQTATSEAGHHQFITFQQQTGAPTITTALTQVGAIYVGSSGDGYPLTFERSAGGTVVLVNSAGNIPVITTGTQGSIAICSSANPNALVALAGSTEGYVLHTHSGTAAPSFLPIDLTGTSTILSGILPAANGGTGHTKLKAGSQAVSAGSNNITFTGTFSNTSYILSISMSGAGAAAVTTYVTSKSTGGFGYETNGNYVLDYIAIGD